MWLKLNGIEVDCIIGERPEERTCEQRLEVGVEIEIDDAAAYSDDLADTVDYAALKSRIVAALQAAKCKLIERAAKVVCDVCLAEPKARRVRASVVKAGILPGLKSAEVAMDA